MLVPIGVPGGFNLVEVVEIVFWAVFRKSSMFISRGLAVAQFSVSREIR